MGPSHNFVGLYLRNQGICRQSEKNSLNVNISSTCSHNMANFSPLPAEIGWRVWAPQQISTGLACWLRYASTRRSTEVNQTLHDVWLSPGLVHYVYIFGGSCPLTEFCPLSHWLCGHAACCGILRHIAAATYCDTVRRKRCNIVSHYAAVGLRRNMPQHATRPKSYCRS